MMKRIVAWLGFGLMAALLCGTAAAENRYLFIVETSKAMRRSLDMVRECVEASLLRGISGQMRAGDTFGIWTFDSELRTGVFPMQRWSPEARLNLVETTSAFLKQQRCRGKARLSGVLPAMFNVIENSDTITVLIFTDGSQPLQGTPFDDTINQIYAQHRDDLKKANVPFVTVLQARGGKIVKCTIDSAASPVNIAALPPLPETEKSPAAALPQTEVTPPTPPEKTSPAPAVTNAIVSTNAPLVVDYSATAPIPTKGAFKPENNKLMREKTVPEPASTNIPAGEVVQVISNVTASNEPATVLTNEPVMNAREIPTVPETNFAMTEIAGKLPGEPSDVIQPLPPFAGATNPSVETAVVMPPEKSSGSRTILLVAVVLVVVAGGLFILLRPRSREQASGSLITRSFEQRKK